MQSRHPLRFALAAAVLAAPLLVATPAAAETARLLKDINTGVGGATGLTNVTFGNSAVMNDVVYFAASMSAFATTTLRIVP